MFAFSFAQVNPKAWPSISCKRVMITHCHGKWPADFGCPTERIQKESGLFSWSYTSGVEPSQDRKCPPQNGPTLITDMHNSMCHTAVKITAKLSLTGLGRASYPAYSWYLSSVTSEHSEQWRNEKDRHLQDPEEEEILKAIQEARNHFTFEDFQNIFKSWMERLICMIVDNREYSDEHSSFIKSAVRISQRQTLYSINGWRWDEMSAWQQTHISLAKCPIRLRISRCARVPDGWLLSY
jgi:hypothetical protein